MVLTKRLRTSRMTPCPKWNNNCFSRHKSEPSLRRKKHSTLTRNGYDTVAVTTRHGRFAHKRVRLLDQSGRFVEVSAQVISQPLRRSCLHWSSKLPFSQVQRLLQEQTGERLLSEDTLWRICQSQALALDEQQEKIIEQSRHLPGVCYQAATDIYDPEAAESVIFTDAMRCPPKTGPVTELVS